MTQNKGKSIGILHPGAMGISVAATMQNSGYDVYWASHGRGPQSRARAAEHRLSNAETLANLCEISDMIVSVCPPHAAEAVAAEAAAAGFKGVFIDANAISPQKAQRIGHSLKEAGITFVDGGIIGGPAWEPNKTWLYLSGPEAEVMLPYFAAGPLETAVVGNDIGQASALKMCFAAYTKGTSALLSLILAGAEALGVRQDLETQWARNGSDFAAQTQLRVRRVTAKAWRFEGEMVEIAETFAGVGLPDGFHLAAAEIYHHLAPFKEAAEVTELDDVLAALLRPH